MHKLSYLSFAAMTFSLQALMASVSFQAPSHEKDEECCLTGAQSKRVSLRHIEANGLGYKTGYTTLEAFLAPDNQWRCAYFPFVDLRGHLFNDGRWAANAGVGLRYLKEESPRIWGVNLYYDYRGSKRNYNEISFGIESLGIMWDFRANGYIPVGNTKSHLYNPKFAGFAGNNMFIKSKQEFAMGGFDAEVGAHLDRMQSVDFYAGVGPYYFTGEGKHAVGGKARLSGDFWHYLKLEGTLSYDNLFHLIAQGEVTLSVPFGCKPKIRRSECLSCDDKLFLRDRLVQPVIFNEIIVTEHKHKKQMALDPTTGQPLFFWFVDGFNTLASLGTFENPFSTMASLQAAVTQPGDIFYIYPADQNFQSTNYLIAPTGFIMQDNQQLLSIGLKQTIGTQRGDVEIPMLRQGIPVFNQTNNNPLIVIANNNTVSGFNLITTSTTANNFNCFCIGNNTGIVTNAMIKLNLLSPTSGATGIQIANSNGTITIENTYIFPLGSAAGRRGTAINLPNPTGVINITGSTISHFSDRLSLDSVGINITPQSGAHVVVNIVGNTLGRNGFDVNILQAANTASSQVNALIKDNEFDWSQFSSLNLQVNGASSLANYVIDSNTFQATVTSVFPGATVRLGSVVTTGGTSTAVVTYKKNGSVNPFFFGQYDQSTLNFASIDDNTGPTYFEGNIASGQRGFNQPGN